MLAKSFTSRLRLVTLCVLPVVLCLAGCGGGTLTPTTPVINPPPSQNPGAGSTFVGTFSQAAGGYNGSSADVSISGYQFSVQHVLNLFLAQGLGTTAAVPSRGVSINLTDTAALIAGKTYAIPGTGDQSFVVLYTEADQTTSRGWSADSGSIRVDSVSGSNVHVTLLAAHMIPADGTANGRPNDAVGSFTLNGHN